MSPVVDYELRLNNTSANERCPSCGDRFKPSIGIWPFVAGTWQPLCEGCASGTDLTTPAERARIDAEMERRFDH